MTKYESLRAQLLRDRCRILDAKWHAELLRQFGEKRMGDARYNPKIQDAECFAAGEAYRDAHREYLELMADRVA